MVPRLRALVAALALSLAARAASAQIFSGVDVGGGVGGPRALSDAAHAAWLAAAGPITHVQTFEAIPLGTVAPIALGGGITLLTVGAAPPGGGFDLNQVSSAPFDRLGYNTTAGGERFYRFASPFDAPATMTLAFATPVTAFGAYVTGIEATLGTTGLFTPFGGLFLPESTPPGGVPGVQFIGFVFPAPVAGVTFEVVPTGLERDIFGIDDIQISAIPEPSTVALTLGGMVALAGSAARRWRR